MAPKHKTEQPSELMTAAAELDVALRRFGNLTEAIRVAPLSCEKHLRRVGQLFTELGELEPEIDSKVAAMAGVLLQTRTIQEGWVATIQARAETYQRRAAVLERLMGGYRTLGEGVGQLNLALQQTQNVHSAFEGMQELAHAAQALSARCAEEDFCDVARQVDALRQQLVQAAKKLASTAQQGKRTPAFNEPADLAGSKGV